MKNILDLKTLRRNLREFSTAFGGNVYYSVKANPSKYITSALWEAGLTGFDVASLLEMETIRKRHRDVPLLFTHPIKTGPDIHHCYKDHGIRVFVVDCEAELLKLHRLLPSGDVEILIRVKVPIFGDSAMQQFDRKFGAHPKLANMLFRRAWELGFKTGLCFHVGSQQETHNAHLLALNYLADMLNISSCEISTLSVGGGFPASYALGEATEFSGIIPSVASIKRDFPVFRESNIISEPGRCLVADAICSEITVIGVDGTRLFIDDGVYGGLMDCGIAQMRFPISHKSKDTGGKLREFTIFGPTCDPLDVLPDTYFLPYDIQEGDTLLVHKTGAYGSSLSENFNGLVPRQTMSVSGA